MYPDVGGQRLLESLRHEPFVVSRKRPVDAAEAVPCHIVPHPAGLRRVVGPRAGRRRRTKMLRAGGHQVRDGTDARVHEDSGPLLEATLLAEEAEWLDHTHGSPTEGHPAATAGGASRAPSGRLAGGRPDATRLGA